LFIDRHAIRNAVGGIIRWAIEVALTIASCATPGVPCYDSMDEALRDVLDCQAIGIAVADLVVELFPIAPDVSALVEAACLSQRDNLIDKLVKALDDITVQLALMALSGSADVVDDRHLANGKWTGTLGSGNFNGEFSASK
jgi:hypothetical protein